MVTARACHEEPDGKNKMGAKGSGPVKGKAHTNIRSQLSYDVRSMSYDFAYSARHRKGGLRSIKALPHAIIKDHRRLKQNDAEYSKTMK
jgi:hypothetical protein